MCLADVHWINLPHTVDERGVLTAVEAGSDIPFQIKRIFYMYGTPPGVERGDHAHRDTHQIVIPIAGNFMMDLSDGVETQSFELADPNRGLYMPPMIWAHLYGFSPHAACLVLADTHYDRSRSFRSWDEFMRALSAPQVTRS